MSDQKKKLRFRAPLVYLVVALIAASSSVLMYAGAQYFYQKMHTKKSEQALLDNPASADTKANSAPEATNQLRKTSESFRSVAKKVGPAVVNIKATKGGKKAKPKVGPARGRRNIPMPRQEPDDEGGGMPGDPFYEFFGPFFGQPGGPQQQEMPQTSLGSGIIVDKNGTVVTNNHVVEGATEIFVRLSNEKTELKAKIIGTDPKTDLAVLKIEGRKDLPFAEWDDSDAVEVGDWAVAIGSPFTLDQSVTVGIVSAKGRNQVGLGTDAAGDLIQTDAAINPGNSGGPLCDLDGKVMGINTAIYTRSGGYMGIGFAIPSNLAKDIVTKLIAHGKITRGWLGVYIQPLDEDLAKELGVKEGVGVHEVIQSSPAETAGIKAGDVITEVDGKPVKDVLELQRKIGNLKPGESIKLKVVSYSDKKSRNVTVKIGVLPDTEPQAKASGEKEEEPDKIGLVVGPTKGEGVVVEGIQPGSVAEQMLGLEVGDIITRINRQPVNNVAAYKKLIGASKRIYLEIKRKGRTLFFQFALPE